MLSQQPTGFSKARKTQLVALLCEHGQAFAESRVVGFVKLCRVENVEHLASVFHAEIKFHLFENTRGWKLAFNQVVFVVKHGLERLKMDFKADQGQKVNRNTAEYGADCPNNYFNENSLIMFKEFELEIRHGI